MVRSILILILAFSFGLGSDVYNEKCVNCHKDLSYSLQEIFMRYLMAYGGENNLKAGMFHYFIYPSRDISVMPKDFLNEYHVYDHKTIDEESLKKSIDIYWELYRVKGRLK